MRDFVFRFFQQCPWRRGHLTGNFLSIKKWKIKSNYNKTKNNKNKWKETKLVSWMGTVNYVNVFNIFNKKKKKKMSIAWCTKLFSLSSLSTCFMHFVVEFLENVFTRSLFTANAMNHNDHFFFSLSVLDFSFYPTITNGADKLYSVHTWNGTQWILTVRLSPQCIARKKCFWNGERKLK